MNSCDLRHSRNLKNTLEFAVYVFCKFLQIMGELVLKIWTTDCTEAIY